MSVTDLRRPAGKKAQSSPALDARGVVRVYGAGGPASVRAVDGVDLSVARGEFVAIMGPSGCGKSTLLQVLGGLQRPDAGEVCVGGIRVDHDSATGRARLRRRAVGFVFQSYNLVPDLTVFDNVALPALLDHRPRRQYRPRAAALLDRLGLVERADALPSTLSGGERQRAAIARALINDPDVLLADEPTGALDTRATGGVLELLRELHAEGSSIVVVTHDARVATAADRLITMRDGQLVDETDLGSTSPMALSELLGVEGE
jgi:putative ABC transport system ATP-binding protein